MFTWKVEDMALLNERGRMFIGNQRVYGAEHKTSREDKIAFVDFMQDGKLSYLIDISKKARALSTIMPKDQYGNVRPQSLCAWIKRADARGIINNDKYHRGRYYLLGTYRYIQFNRKGDYDMYDDLVDEMFHRQLQRCEEMERQYFLEHDGHSILAKKCVEYERRYGTTFGVIVAHWNDGRLTVIDEEHKRERELTEDELREMIGKYEQIDALVEKLTAETNIVY